MKYDIPKSLEEVWGMKDALREAYEKSGIENFADFIEIEIKEFKKKHNLIFDYEVPELKKSDIPN